MKHVRQNLASWPHIRDQNSVDSPESLFPSVMVVIKCFQGSVRQLVALRARQKEEK